MTDIRPYPDDENPTRTQLRALLGELVRAQQPLEAVVLQIETLYANRKPLVDATAPAEVPAPTKPPEGTGPLGTLADSPAARAARPRAVKDQPQA